MRLQRLTVKDFMIFGESDIDLSDVGLASIIGEYATDARRSNGAGKSAFMEAIRFALFDQTRGKSKHGVIREGCDSCFVDLVFSIGGSEIRVARTRSLSGASKARLWIDDVPAADKVRIVNGAIADRIGVNADLFDLIYFFKQGDQFGFAEANASDRKAILSKVFRMRQLEMCSDAAKERLRDCRERSAQIAGSIQATEQQIESFLSVESLIEESLDASAALANTMQLKEARKESMDDLRLSVDDARGFQSYFSAMAGSDANQKTTIQLAIADIDKSIESKGRQLMERRKKENDSREMYESIKKLAIKPKGDIEDLKVTRANLNNDLRVFTAKCVAAKADLSTCSEKLGTMQINDDQCPTCGQAVEHEKCESIYQSLRDTVESLNDFIADLERNIDLVESEIAACTRDISRHEQYAFKVKACENAWNNVQNCEDNANECREDINKLKQDKDCLQKELDRVSQSQVDDHAIFSEKFVGILSSLAGRVVETSDAMSDRISEMVGESNAADFQLASYRQQVGRLAEYQEQQRACDNDIAISTALTEAFGKDGIQALVIENALGAVEQFANEVLQQMHTKFVVELKTQRQTKTGEDKESLDILIYDGRSVRMFESYSGGERTLINLSLRLALSKAISALHGVSIQSLFMDEVFGALDEVNREEVVKVLSFLSRSFAQVLVVSHTDQVKDVIDSGIVIRRYEDKSEIRKTNARREEAGCGGAS